MTIDEQIRLLQSVGAGDVDFSEIMQTLQDCQRLVTEKDKDTRNHLFHFMKQRLTGQELPARIKIEAEIKLNLTTGQWLEYAGRMLQFISIHGIDLLAMDKTGKEVKIPQIQWKNIRTLPQTVGQ